MPMTGKRTLSWLGAATATLALGAAAAWLLWPDRQRITAQSYARLRPGMTRAAVEDLLGGPGRSRQDFSAWLDNRSPTIGAGTDLLNEHRHQPGIAYWYQDSGVIVLRFDAEGRVADQQFLQVRVSTARQRLRRLLERIGW
jgi:hypothetical protein